MAKFVYKATGFDDVTVHFDFILEGMNTRKERPIWHYMVKPEPKPYESVLSSILNVLSNYKDTTDSNRRERPLLSFASPVTMACERNYVCMSQNNPNVIRFDPVAFYINTSYVSKVIDMCSDPWCTEVDECLKFFTAIRDAIDNDTRQLDQLRVICWVAFCGKHSCESYANPKHNMLCPAWFIIEKLEYFNGEALALTEQGVSYYTRPCPPKTIELLSLFENTCANSCPVSIGALSRQIMLDEAAEVCPSLSNVTTRVFQLETPINDIIRDICNVPSNPRSFELFPLFNRLSNVGFQRRVVCIQADVKKRELEQFFDEHTKRINHERTPQSVENVTVA